MSRENHASEAKPRFRIAWARHAVQIFALALFCTPLLTVGWQLAGLFPGSEDALPTPAELPFFGSLSSSTVAGVNVLDPFAMLQIAAASKTFALSWLTGMLPVLIVYGLIRGRAFCGWVCPVNLLLECTDLSVFARTVQEAVSVPVYDINSLIAYAAFCVRRNQWV